MERADASLPSSGPAAAGIPPALMEQSQAKRPRAPEEAEQVCAIPVAPHGPWSWPHLAQQLCCPPPPWGTAGQHSPPD
eukprot:scaffold136838_cov33-Tisochrysis_lutea.AAC.3